MMVVNAGVMLWARSEWRRRWGALLLLATLIAIGGGATVAAVAAARRTDTAFDRMLDATREPNLTVFPQSFDLNTDFDPALLNEVMRIEGVTGVSQVALVAVSVADYPSFYSVAYLDERGDASRPIYVEGSGPESVAGMAADEMVINEAMRDLLGAGVGATFQLQSLTSEQFLAAFTGNAEVGAPQGPTMAARVVGVYRLPEDVSDSPDPFLVFSDAFYDTYVNAIGSCRCVLLVNTAPDAVESVAAALAVIYPEGIVEQTEDFGARLKDTVSMQRRAWQLMALAAALAGVVTLLFACGRFVQSMMVGDAARQAIGMARSERVAGRFLIIAPSAVLGSVVAAAFAYVLSSLAPVGITRRAEPTPGRLWDPVVCVPGVAAVLLVSLLVIGATSVVVRRRTGRLHLGLRVGGPVASLGSRLASGPGRVGITGMFLATAGLVAAMTIDRSIDRALTSPELYGADYDAGFDVSDGDWRAVSEELAADPDIEAVALGSNKLFTDVPVQVTGPDGSRTVEPSARENLKGTISMLATEGRAPLLPNEVAIGRAVMNEIGADVGDRVTVTGERGAVEMIIVGNLVNPGADETGGGFEVTIEGLNALVMDPTVGHIEVRFAAGADHAAVIERHRDVDFSLVRPPSEVANMGELGGLPGRVGQLLVLLGIAALINAVVVTVGHGRRQVAIHRALGFTSAQVVGAHLWQSALMVITGGAVGGVAGFLVGRAIHHELVDNVGAIAQTVVPGELWAVAFTAIAVAFVAGALMSGLALRHRPGAVLRAE